MTVSRIEKFQELVRRSLEAMGRRLPKTSGDEIGEALDRIKIMEKTRSWQPEPKEPGQGTVGEATRRMSRGGRP